MFFVLLLLSIFFYIKNNSRTELIKYACYVVSTGMFFYLCLNDPMSLKQMYFVLDIVFYITVYYIVSEGIFNSTPYQAIHAVLGSDALNRAKGLTGHPLLLSSFLSFYNSALITRCVIFKKWDIFNFVLLLPAIVLCNSRTVLLIVLFSWVLYILLTRAYKKVAFYIILGILAVGSLTFLSTIEKLTSNVTNRIRYSDVDSRIAAYSIAPQVLINTDFLGVGLDPVSLRSELGRVNLYQIDGEEYDRQLLVFDNSYLTAMASYGIFGILIFVPFIQPVYRFWKRSRDKVFRLPFYAILIVFVLAMAQNFSFDCFLYFSVNSIYFLLVGLIIKDANSKELSISIQKRLVTSADK